MNSMRNLKNDLNTSGQETDNSIGITLDLEKLMNQK
jgi:hypothetical protein